MGFCCRLLFDLHLLKSLVAMTTNNIFRLRGSIQNYDWGKKGKDSLVAGLGPNAIGDDFEFSEDSYYAEVRLSY